MMQQTNNYQFNLVEPSDAFSPVPLNENMEKVEAALGFGGATCRIAEGSYVGTGEHGTNKPSTLTFAFKPMAIFLAKAGGGSNFALLFRPVSLDAFSGHTLKTTWADNSVSWYATASDAAQYNDLDVTYHWVALGQ